jgi:hypothetical protein
MIRFFTPFIIIAAVAFTTVTPLAAQSTPNVFLDSYTGKPSETMTFGANGFAPNEPIDVSLGEQQLTTVNADALGDVVHGSAAIPNLGAGDYTLSFVGRTSQTRASVGFNIQGFRPWVVLRNYFVTAQQAVGFDGQDFIPGETIAVYLNSRLSAPVVQVNADGQGRIAMEGAVPAANLKGDNQLIFVGQQSQSELTTTFTVASP